MKIPLSALLAAVVFSLAPRSPLSADDLPRSRYEIYFALESERRTLGGSLFDGRHTLPFADRTIAMPRIDPALGLGGTAGFRVGLQRWPIELSGEVSVISSRHRGVFQSKVYDADFLTIDLNNKIHFLPGHHLRPFLLGGVGLPFVQLNGAAQPGILPFSEDAYLFGMTYNLGAGLSYYIHPKLSLEAGVLYRFLDFGIVRTGVAEWSKISNGASADSLSLRLTLTYHWTLKQL
jgi:opacity protein-like surface antigen